MVCPGLQEVSLKSGFSASDFRRVVSAYSHGIDLERQGPQGGPVSSHFTRRRLQVTHPSRDFRCGRRVAIVVCDNDQSTINLQVVEGVLTLLLSFGALARF